MSTALSVLEQRLFDALHARGEVETRPLIQAVWPDGHHDLHDLHAVISRSRAKLAMGRWRIVLAPGGYAYRLDDV